MDPAVKRIAVLLLLGLVAGCVGDGAPTASPAATSAPDVTTAAGTPTAAGDDPAAELCLLTVEDWHQFNYVTGAEPDVTSDAPGTAICQYASGPFLEVYAEGSEEDAAATFQTIVDNAPFDDPQELAIPGADEVLFDPEISEDHAGIAVRAGRLAFTISALARDSVQQELMTLAGLVLARSADLQ